MNLANLIEHPLPLSDNYLPQKLPGHRTQMDEIMGYIKAAQAGLSNSVYVYGGSGSGKTVLLKRIVEEYNAVDGKMKVVYIDVSEKQSFCGLVDFILLKLGAIQPEKSIGAKFTTLRTVLARHPTVIIIDEFDKLMAEDKERLLFNLYEGGAAGIIAVGHSSDYLYNADQGLRSRMFKHVIHFPHYSSEELYLILKARAEEALHPETFDVAILRYIAERSGGDARRAIQALRYGLITMTKNRFNRLSIECVSAGLSEAVKGQAEYILNRLSPHHRLIYTAIKCNPSLISSRLYRAYSKSARQKGLIPVANRTFTAYLDSLLNDALIRPHTPSMRGRTRTFSIVEEEEIP